MSAALEAALQALAAAVADEGPAPFHHRRIMREHRREWPTLWHAIDRILAARIPHNGAPNAPAAPGATIEASPDPPGGDASAHPLLAGTGLAAGESIPGLVGVP